MVVCEWNTALDKGASACKVARGDRRVPMDTSCVVLIRGFYRSDEVGGKEDLRMSRLPPGVKPGGGGTVVVPSPEVTVTPVL